MSKKLVIRGGTKLLGALDSGLGDPILTRDDTSKEVGSISAIDSSTFLSTALTSGYLIVGNSSNIATPRQVTGHVSISDLGVINLASNVITNTHVFSAAGIAYSKLNLTASIINTDIAAAANIARTKIANGNTYRVLINNGSGVFSEATAITASRALISDANGIPTHSSVTSTTLSYLDVSSSVQTQLNNRLLFSSGIVPVNGDLVSYTGGVWTRVPIGAAGYVLTSTGTDVNWSPGTSNGLPSGGTADQYLRKVDGVDYNTTWDTLTVSKITDLTASAAELNILDGATLTTAELNYVDGATSNLQAQITARLVNALAYNSIFVGNISGQAAQLSSGPNGYVLTSVAGVPQWQALPSSGHVIQNSGVDLTTEPALNFTNGLTAVDNPAISSIVKLGGTITEDTDISGAFGLTFGVTGTALNYWAVESTNNMTFESTGGGVQFLASTTVGHYGFGIEMEATNTAFIGYGGVGGPHSLTINSTGPFITLTGANTFAEAADYSANYVARSYISKGYADTTYAPISGSTNYWRLSNGGTLTGANTISGAFDLSFTNTTVKFTTDNLRVRNPANTFEYTIASRAITIDRTLNLPLVGSGTWTIMATNSVSATSGHIPFGLASLAGWTSSSNLAFANGTSTFSTVNANFTGTVFVAPSGTITASTQVDIRGIATTSALGLRIADSLNNLRYSITDAGDATYVGNTHSYSPASSGTVTLTAAATLAINATTSYVVISGRGTSTGKSIDFSLLNSLTDLGKAYNFIGATHNVTSATNITTVTINVANSITNSNVGGTANVTGLLYNPTISNAGTLNHFAAKFVSGDVAIGIAEATATSAARLNVRGNGTSTGLTLLLEGSGGTDTFGFQDQGYAFFYVAPQNDDALTQVLVRDSGTGELKYRTASTLSGGSVAGSNTEVQFNNGGAFGADADFTFASNVLKIGQTGAFSTEISTSSIVIDQTDGSFGISMSSAGAVPNIQSESGILITNAFSGTGDVTIHNGNGDVILETDSAVNGDIIIETDNAGTGTFKINDGADEQMGVATLASGNVTVNNTKITANTRVFLSRQSISGTEGFLRISARTAGTSFTITSSSGSDGGTIAWLLIEPN